MIRLREWVAFPRRPAFCAWKPAAIPIGALVRESSRTRKGHMRLKKARLRLRAHDKRKRWWL